MIDGFAFLPVDQVGDGMKYLKSIMPEDVEKAEDLLMYFDRVYISGSYCQIPNTSGVPGVLLHHIQPMFPLQIWNVHEATVNDQSRTNNICISVCIL